MPYIKKEKRELFDNLVEEIVKKVQKTNEDLTSSPAGDLNYIISTLLEKVYYPYGPSYSYYNEIIGILECAKLEFYSRVARPYENTKIIENGDVYDKTVAKIKKKASLNK